MNDQFHVLVSKNATLSVSLAKMSWALAKTSVEHRLLRYLIYAQDEARDKGFSLTLGEPEFTPEGEIRQNGVTRVEVWMPVSISCNQAAKTKKQAAKRVAAAFDFALNKAVALARKQNTTLYVEDETVAFVSQGKIYSMILVK